MIDILFATTAMGGIFLTVDWRHVGWIFIQVGSTYAEILAVRIYPVPQFFICIPSLGIGLAVHAHEIGREPVAVATAQAPTVVRSV